MADDSDAFIEEIYERVTFLLKEAVEDSVHKECCRLFANDAELSLTIGENGFSEPGEFQVVRKISGMIWSIGGGSLAELPKLVDEATYGSMHPSEVESRESFEAARDAFRRAADCLDKFLADAKRGE